MEYDESRGSWLVTIGLFAAWLVTSIGAILDALYIREAILAGLSLINVYQMENFHRQGDVGLDFSFGFAMTFYDNVALLILGCSAIAFVIWVEYYFRKGRIRGQLLKRIGKIIGIEAAVIVVAILVRIILT